MSKKGKKSEKKKNMRQFIYYLLIGFAGINFFLVLTGIVLPWLISSNQIPIVAIVFLSLSIIFCIMSVIGCFIYKNMR